MLICPKVVEIFILQKSLVEGRLSHFKIRAYHTPQRGFKLGSQILHQRRLLATINELKSILTNSINSVDVDKYLYVCM